MVYIIWRLVSHCLSFFLFFLHRSISVSVSMFVPLSLLSGCSPPLSAAPLICPSFSSRLCGLTAAEGAASGQACLQASTALPRGVCVCACCVWYWPSAQAYLLWRNALFFFLVVWTAAQSDPRMHACTRTQKCIHISWLSHRCEIFINTNLNEWTRTFFLSRI